MKGTVISSRPKRPASARHWAAYNVIAASKGPPTRAFSHNEIGTIGKLQVTMVSTEYARDTIATNTMPVAAIIASSSRCSHAKGLTENEYSQYGPLHANNPTALTTSFERGLEASYMKSRPD